MPATQRTYTPRASEITHAWRVVDAEGLALGRLASQVAGFLGGFKAVSLGEVLERHPERVVKHAVRGMLPHNALGRKMLRKLKIYAGPDHPHQAQLRATSKQQQPAA